MVFQNAPHHRLTYHMRILCYALELIPETEFEGIFFCAYTHAKDLARQQRETGFFCVSLHTQPQKHWNAREAR